MDAPRGRFTSNPSEDRTQWFVWDTGRFPPEPIYVGTMEECGGVADVLNARRDGDINGARKEQA
jgi:hypothetical protein